MYFKTNKITEYKSEIIESAIRKSALKRHSSLDLKFTSTYISENGKYFLGYENDKKMDLLRISSPFEKFLPKIIITFKKNDFTEYKIRLKITSMIILFMISLFLILTIYFSIKYNKSESDILSILAINLFFYFLAYIEYKLTTRKIIKIINQINKN